jgi:nucleoside-diphosphate-sugar epimerase
MQYGFGMQLPIAFSRQSSNLCLSNSKRMATREKVLIIGAGGQIGTELTEFLREKYTGADVIATDVRENEGLAKDGPFFLLDVMDKDAIYALVEREKVTQIYHLAALLSATGEKNPEFAWKLNMEGLLHVLNAARDLKVAKVFWPSSIAVFGPGTPANNTPQDTVMDPNTVYGISKLAGERWCEYYYNRYGVDVRSLRYPGLIGYKSAPGGGTTDYAVDIFHQALQKGTFTCFLKPETALPMMYMPDAIRATIALMDAPAEQVKIRSSYNLAGISFTPAEIAAAIQKHIPNFNIDYAPDFRQAIADSWPNSIDDTRAAADWGWKMDYDLESMTQDMLHHIGIQLGKSVIA